MKYHITMSRTISLPRRRHNEQCIPIPMLAINANDWTINYFFCEEEDVCTFELTPKLHAMIHNFANMHHVPTSNNPEKMLSIYCYG